MHNEKQFTSNQPDSTSGHEKNLIDSTQSFVGRVDTPYGAQYINRGEARDHASMCSLQITSLLKLMRAERGGVSDRFIQLGAGHQDSLLWLVEQLADELSDMIDIVAADEKAGAA